MPGSTKMLTRGREVSKKKHANIFYGWPHREKTEKMERVEKVGPAYLFNVVVVFVVLVVAGRIGDWSTRGRNGILTRVTPGVTH